MKQLNINGKTYSFYDIMRIEEKRFGKIRRMPFSIRILVENLLRKYDGKLVRESDLVNIASWKKHYETPVEMNINETASATSCSSGRSQALTISRWSRPVQVSAIR